MKASIQAKETLNKQQKEEKLAFIHDEVVPEPPQGNENKDALMDYMNGYHKGIETAIKVFDVPASYFDSPTDSDWAQLGYNAGMIMASRRFFDKKYNHYNMAGEDNNLDPFGKILELDWKPTGKNYSWSWK